MGAHGARGVADVLDQGVQHGAPSCKSASSAAKTEAARAKWAIVAKVSESVPAVKPPLDCVSIKQRFMAAIGNPEPGTEGQPI